MDGEVLRRLLADVHAGTVDVEEAVRRLRHLPFEKIASATIDHHRAIRCGFPEVVYAEGKTAEQVTAIVGRLAAAGGNVLVTRAAAGQFDAVQASQPSAVYHRAARAITIRQTPIQLSAGTIAIVSAGTSDEPVAEEACVTAEIMDQRVECIYDVGVAGIHRLLAHHEMLQTVNVCVVVAGMEGALASVVGGLVACPVIAVPTSVGYGASFGGVAALLAMLNSCSSGVTVVNIDNGFAAGYTASLINRLAERRDA